MSFILYIYNPYQIDASSRTFDFDASLDIGLETFAKRIPRTTIPLLPKRLHQVPGLPQ